ncbi:MAG: hypothetical protein AAFX04_00550 [Pseudomonadota bacterium]
MGFDPRLFPHAVAATLLLTACGPAENDPGPGGVTVGEAKMLDEAAEMLDARQADYGSAAPQQAPAAAEDIESSDQQAGAAE